MNPEKSELLQDLQREEERRAHEESLLQEAEELLRSGREDDERILERLKDGRPTAGPAIDPEGLPEERVFSEGAIRRICVKYRLRFLSTRYFNDELPYEAVSGLRDLEKRTGQEIEDLRIVAPSERFELQDSTKDPLLFASLGNGKYYLIHRWGGELSGWRKWLNYPFRSVQSLLTTCGIVALLISMLIPESFLQAGGNMHPNLLILLRGMSFFLLASFFITASFIFGITTSREFSSDQWNSRFFN